MLTPLMKIELQERLEQLYRIAKSLRVLAESDKKRAMESEGNAAHAEQEYREMKQLIDKNGM
jgi:hypothetical protein